MILIIDYGMGNLRSVEKAFQHLGADAHVSSDPSLIQKASKIVLPGVGAFDHAVQELQKRSLFDPIRTAVAAGKPYLGLCLGLQLLFEGSDEGKEKGFGLLPGRVLRFPQGEKVPHMGWNEVSIAGGDSPFWKGIPQPAYFYFVHSYYAAPANGWSEGRTRYGVEFASVVRKGNIFATQFHPEKSQENGLRLLKNYIEAA